MSLGGRFGFVIFGMFELTSVSFGISLNLVAEGMAHTPRWIALLRGGSLAGFLWHGLIWPLTIREGFPDATIFLRT